MPTPKIELEGAWEEILEGDAELRGKRVRVTVVEDHADDPSVRASTGSDLIKRALGWAGTDFEECLKAVYESRSRF